MKVLLIKTSSMGDILHTLPALTDAAKAIPTIEFHWVVEENFAEIPSWHPHVTKIIPIALRRWRKHIFTTLFSKEWRNFKQLISNESYDLIIDAQGLLKSAWITRLAKGPIHGLSKASAREPLASIFYHHKHVINPQQHAVTRLRQLFAKALGYSIPQHSIDYAIDPKKLPILSFALPAKYVVALHGTTWASKHYPVNYWQQLITYITRKSLAVVLPWGNAAEKIRAETLAHNNPLVHILPTCNLGQIAQVLVNANAVITVDTGLSHLSAALNKPTIGLYGPTNPALTGTIGQYQIHLAALKPSCAPCLQRRCTYQGTALERPACFDSVNPDRITPYLNQLLENSND